MNPEGTIFEPYNVDAEEGFFLWRFIRANTVHLRWAPVRQSMLTEFTFQPRILREGGIWPVRSRHSRATTWYDW